MSTLEQTSKNKGALPLVLFTCTLVAVITILSGVAYRFNWFPSLGVIFHPLAGGFTGLIMLAGSYFELRKGLEEGDFQRQHLWIFPTLLPIILIAIAPLFDWFSGYSTNYTNFSQLQNIFVTAGIVFVLQAIVTVIVASLHKKDNI